MENKEDRDIRGPYAKRVNTERAYIWSRVTHRNTLFYIFHPLFLHPKTWQSIFYVEILGRL